MSEEKQAEIIAFITEEKERMSFGKLFIELTIQHDKITNIQAETRRSQSLIEKNV